MEYEGVALTFEAQLATITLNDPERLNALTPPMVRSIDRALWEVRKPRRKVRALLITGAGRGFCAGANLFAAKSDGAAVDTSSVVESVYHPMIRRLRDVEVPVIAAVNGPAVGVGFAISLMADYLLAAEEAYFLAPFRNLASGPDCGLTWLLPRAIGPARAREVLMLGARLPAAKAQAWGMVNEVAPASDLPALAHERAMALAAGPTVSLSVMRRLFQTSASSTLDAHLEDEARGVSRTVWTRDNATALRAFGSKTPVDFVGE